MSGHSMEKEGRKTDLVIVSGLFQLIFLPIYF